MSSNGHDQDPVDADSARDDELRRLPEGFDPQQLHELLAGYQAQVDRLEQMLTTVQVALGVQAPAQGELSSPGMTPPDGQALQLAADYRPSSVRFDPTPISMRIAPGVQAPMPPRRNGNLWSRMALEMLFLALVIAVLAVLHVGPPVIVAGGAGGWIAVLLVEFLLSRTQPRTVHAHVAEERAAAPPAVARPEILMPRLSAAAAAPVAPSQVLPWQESLPLDQEPFDAIATGPDDVWVVPQEVLIAGPVLDDHPAVADVASSPLEDTLETDEPLAEDESEGETEVVESEPGPEPEEAIVAEPAEALPAAATGQEADVVVDIEAEQDSEHEAPANGRARRRRIRRQREQANAGQTEPEPLLLEVEEEPEPEPAREAEAEPEPTAVAADSEPAEEALLPVGAAPTAFDWPPVTTGPVDSWERLIDPAVAAGPNGSTRHWAFGRRTTAQPAAPEPQAPPDLELARVAQPLPPVVIDPLADAREKRRRRRRRG
jgi:hypothetical protein